MKLEREPLIAGMEACGIPSYMQEGLLNYLIEGIVPGSFLTAVLENNLRGACRCADETNIDLIPNYVKFLYNFAPMVSWGSEELVTNYHALHVERRKVHASSDAGASANDDTAHA